MGVQRSSHTCYRYVHIEIGHCVGSNYLLPLLWVCRVIWVTYTKTCFSSTYLHPLSRSDQSILLCIPATQHDGTTRSPPLGSQGAEGSGYLLQNCCPRVRVNCSKYPRIPVVTKDHYLVWFYLPIYGANDIIDGLLFLVVVDLDECLAVNWGGEEDRRGREGEKESTNRRIRTAWLFCYVRVGKGHTPSIYV